MSAEKDPWGPIILHKQPERKKDDVAKYHGVHDPSRKLENEEFPQISKVNHNVSFLISSERQKKGLKQKELASAICEREQVVHDYESGTAKPESRILLKMERVLGVKLCGQNIGQEIISKHKK